jgi:hypothetical protein
MNTPQKDRRSFLKGAGRTMLACGCVLTLPVQRAMAADACASQTADSQATMTLDAALKRLKDGNARLCRGHVA